MKAKGFIYKALSFTHTRIDIVFTIYSIYNLIIDEIEPDQRIK